MKNVRLSITLTQPQSKHLRVQADRLGISVADMIRRIVDQHRGAGRPAPAPTPKEKTNAS